MALPLAQAELLRDRAATCRHLAGRIDRAELLHLAARTGSETWIGPTATAFEQDLALACRELDLAADELRRAARRLEEAARQADLLTP